jgi:hypothetical protein
VEPSPTAANGADSKSFIALSDKKGAAAHERHLTHSNARVFLRFPTKGTPSLNVTAHDRLQKGDSARDRHQRTQGDKSPS